MSTVTRRALLSAAATAGAVAVLPRAKAQTGHGRTLALQAKPGPVNIDTAKAAVVVVDMQNDFGSVGGMFERAGIDISGIQRAIAPTAKTIETARRASMKIVYLKMAYRPDLSDLGEPQSANRLRHLELGVGQHVRAPDGRASRVLVRDTWNTDIVAELTPKPDDLVIYKTRYSGFFNTILDEKLKSWGIEDLIVTGCTTSICVESTVRDAMFRDYRCVVLEDCTSEPLGGDFARSNHEASLLSIQALLGWVSDSSELARAVAASVAA